MQDAYYAHKLERLDGPRYLHATVRRDILRYFGKHDRIVKLRIRERLPTDPEEPRYFGWLGKDADHYVMIWHAESLFETCFQSGSKERELRGFGRKVKLVLEEVNE